MTMKVMIHSSIYYSWGWLFSCNAMVDMTSTISVLIFGGVNSNNNNNEQEYMIDDSVPVPVR
jgi:hypothetical protein